MPALNETHRALASHVTYTSAHARLTDSASRLGRCSIRAMYRSKSAGNSQHNTQVVMSTRRAGLVAVILFGALCGAQAAPLPPRAVLCSGNGLFTAVQAAPPAASAERDSLAALKACCTTNIVVEGFGNLGQPCAELGQGMHLRRLGWPPQGCMCCTTCPDKVSVYTLSSACHAHQQTETSLSAWSQALIGVLAQHVRTVMLSLRLLRRQRRARWKSHVQTRRRRRPR
jgi:hypothetical protein